MKKDFEPITYDNGNGNFEEFTSCFGSKKNKKTENYFMGK